jgi:serine protease Do
MTGWIAATAATALLGIATGPMIYAQSWDWRGWDESQPLVVELAQNAMFGDGPGQIGVSVRDVDEADVKGGKAASGVVVEDVQADSPAQKAGFRAGDVVVEFDGERVRSTRQFVRLVQESPSGRQIATVVMRDGQRVTLNVEPREGGRFGFKSFGGQDDFKLHTVPKLAARPQLKLFPERFEALIGGSGRLGITIDDLSPQLAEYFGTKDGVLVTSVTDNSNASKAGVKAGDVITSLDGQNITSAADLRTRTQRLDSGEEFTVGVIRDKKPMTLKGKMEQPPARRRVSRAIL